MTEDDKKPKSEPKEPEVIWADGVREAAERDPKLAEFLREFGATARQALAGIQSGQYESFDEAMEKLTGHRPTRVDEDEAEELAAKFLVKRKKPDA